MISRKAFTLAEFAIVIIIIAMLFSIIFAGVVRKKPDDKKKIPEKFSIIYSQDGGTGSRTIYTFLVIKDKDTEQEYIAVLTHDGVSITPRIPAK